jgi:hypothetical protein
MVTLPDGTKTKGRLRLADPTTGHVAVESD